MKKIMFVGAGEFQVAGIIEAKKQGYLVIAIDGNENAFGKHYADEFYHLDVKDKERIYELAKGKNIDGICTIAAEVSVETVAFVSEKLNLTGNPLGVAELCHNKDQYYEHLGSNGINVPSTINYGEYDYKSLDTEYVIVKPSTGSGSRLVKKLPKEEVDQYVQQNSNAFIKDEKILIQEFIEGKEITVDGFSINGNPYILAISEEKSDAEISTSVSFELEFPPLWMNKEVQNNIIATSGNISKQLGIHFGPFHMEYIITEENKLYLIDFALRGGGFKLFTDIIKKTSKIDVVQKYIAGIMGEPISIEQPEVFSPVMLKFIYSNKEGVIKEIQGENLEGTHDDYILGFLKKEGESTQKPKSGRDRLAYIISWGNEMEEVKKKVTNIEKQIKFCVE